MSSTLKLSARATKQGDTLFYYTSIPAVDLIDEDKFTADRWNNASQQGYQREINEPHSRRIAQFIRGKGGANTNVLPTPVVINIRGKLTVSTPDANGMVTIEVSDREPGYIIDGQHRIEGVRKISKDDENDVLDSYELGVILTNFNLEEEMVHFKNLNGTSNRPSKSLAQVIGHQLYQLSGEAPVTWNEQATNSAVALTIRLATDPASPFFGKIAIGGLRKRSFHTTVQSAFVQALMPLFTNGRFSDPTIQPEITYQYVLHFWKAVQAVWPEAMANPESSTIQRTVGLNPLTKVLVKIFNNMTINPSPELMERTLREAATNLLVDDAAWEARPNAKLNVLRSGYSLNRGTTIVADYLWSGVDPSKTSTHTN